MGFFDFIFGKVFNKKHFVSVETTEKIKSDWNTIDTLVKQGKPSQLKQALITADKTVDAALKDLVEGETMGQRLKNAKDLFNDYAVYDKIWKAHKIRNNVVHEAGYEPPHYVITEAIENLRRGLFYLGVNV